MIPRVHEKCHWCDRYINLDNTDHDIVEVEGEKVFVHHTCSHYIVLGMPGMIKVVESVHHHHHAHA